MHIHLDRVTWLQFVDFAVGCEAMLLHLRLYQFHLHVFSIERALYAHFKKAEAMLLFIIYTSQHRLPSPNPTPHCEPHLFFPYFCTFILCRCWEWLTRCHVLILITLGISAVFCGQEDVEIINTQTVAYNQSSIFSLFLAVLIKNYRWEREKRLSFNTPALQHYKKKTAQDTERH